MRRTSWFHFAAACATLGLILAVAGGWLAASHRSTEHDRLDTTLATTAGEKAALVDTELERARALAQLTARIPPFAELYADAGSQAAAIAAVAGPLREINDALAYLWRLYPDQLVEAGYIDLGGAENARVVRGAVTPVASLRRDVRAWPSFAQGLRTPAGHAWISAPFTSPTAGVAVVAATAPVIVDGRPRAYVELELSVAAIQRVLSSDVDADTSVAVLTRTNETVTGVGRPFSGARLPSRAGLASMDGWRFAVHPMPAVPDAGGDWLVVAAARQPSALRLAFAPAQAILLGLAVLLLGVAVTGLRRARTDAARHLAIERRRRVEAERRARIDALTGLFNRRHAMETIEHELVRAGRQGSAVGLLQVDIDHFKQINDAHRHIGGDAVLIEVARRLQAGARRWDTVARTGGEEFCVVAPAVHAEAIVAELGERLRLAVAERPVLVDDVEVPVTVSVGVALIHDGQGSAEGAVDHADRALYAAKHSGRNRVCRFSDLDEGKLTAPDQERRTADSGIPPAVPGLG
jgi:diguanylate cyclase (GGDEF)-like protein